MKIGLLSAILPDNTFEEVIDIASQNGFEAVEICCWPAGKSQRRYAGVTHIDVDLLTEKSAKYYLDYASRKGIEITALGYYPNPLDIDNEKAEYYANHIRKVIKAANLLGVNKVSTFIGKNHTLSIDENFELFKQVWPSIIKLAEKENVKVAIENCPMYFTKDEWPGGKNLASSPANWRRMFEIIPSSNFGLTYDPSHLHLQGMDYIKPLFEFTDKIFHIHLKDIKVDQLKIDEFGIFTHPLNYMDPKIPGKGGIDWKKFIESLKQVNYKNSACIEIEDKDYENSHKDIIQGIKESYKNVIDFF